MKKRFGSLLFCLLLIGLLTLSVSAHSGGTDSNGGHTNRSTGEYHYHHGYPAHDHYDMNGDGVVDCPYEFNNRTNNRSGTADSSGSYQTGYDNGYEDGYDAGQDHGEETGYNTGYRDGKKEMESVMKTEVEAERKDASMSAFLTTLLFGSPVVAFISSYLAAKVCEKREEDMEREIRKLKEELRMEKNRVSLRQAGIDVDVLGDIPSDITLKTACIPIKGRAQRNRPYGDYTVYTSVGGKRYHYKYGCSNATKSMHYFNITANLEPCKNCVPSNMQSQSIPNWYWKISDKKRELIPERNPTKLEASTLKSKVGPDPTSGIKELQYENGSLFVTFGNGEKYRYEEVPELYYLNLVASDSREDFFMSNIYDAYPYLLIQ